MRNIVRVAALFAVIGMPIAIQYTSGVTYAYAALEVKMGPSAILSITA